MDIPLCCGMERSASTLAWQIIKSIVPRSRPLGWEPHCEVLGWKGHPVDWPVKRHHYFGGDRPVVYTYRNPVEAFLSARRVFGSDAGIAKMTECENQQDADKMALEKITDHLHIYQTYLGDQSQGRKVLFLKYEDFYFDPVARINKIASFLEIDPPLTEDELSILCDYTHIDKNIKRASMLTSFNDDRDPNTGMQAAHIDTDTLGKPGALLLKHPSFVHAVKNKTHGLELLHELCETMDYQLPSPQQKKKENLKINFNTSRFI